MKWVGAALVLAAASLICLILLDDQKQHLEVYHSLSETLKILRGELLSRGATISEGIEKAGSASRGVGKELMLTVMDGLRELGERSFSEIWRNALATCSQEEKPESLETLAGLGSVLGRFDLDEQLKALDTCIKDLDERWEAEKKDYPARRKLLISLSLAGGIFLVILLF